MEPSPAMHKIVAFRQRLEARLGGRYTMALTSILVALIAYPLSGGNSWLRVGIDLWIFVSLGFLLVSLREKNFSRVEIILLAALTASLACANLASSFSKQIPVLVYAVLLPFSVIFFFICAWLIVKSIFKERQVNTDMLCGAVLAYLLIGIGWSGIYGLIDLTVIDAFAFPEGTPGDKGASLIYFSFVTLTTLGYGDIHPVAEIARTAAYLQAVTGVMFGAIFVAAIVGNWNR